uniref:Protein Gawky n=1 Tax=Lygus hesperus TaxID=30085 RepID=A0A0A9Y428_LYGHE
MDNFYHYGRPIFRSRQNKVSHWKEMPATAAIGRGGLPPTMTRGNSNMKPDQPLWPHHPRNNGWGEGGGMVDVGGPWGDEKPAPWMDQTVNPSWIHGGPKHKPSWDGSDLDPSSWVGHPNKQPSKPISKEVIWTSKQFRMLTDMGYKKEDVENALRASSLSLEEALEQLNASRNLGDRWRHSDLDPDHGGIINPFPSPQQAICIPFQSSSRAQQTQQPSPQQLRMLVQQIQMAVQSGFLSPQILNQPLAPQTLLLLNQLLQQIKTLQQLTQQMQHHQLMSGNSLGKSNQVLQISVQITKTKQQITNLQNQIAAQQAVYVKQAQQTPPTDFFNKHEPINLHPSFSDLSLKDTHGENRLPFQSTSTSQQSRLNQWKLPALDKDSDIGTAGQDFSRAPGTTTKATPGNSSPNMNPLLGQPDGTWSSVSRNNCDTGWPDSGTDDSSSKDWPSSTQPPSQAFSDLVPEFEPGKPWKGNPLKSIEDDPSLTPGSVMPSPLSIPSLKDTQILSSSASMQGKASPTTSSSLDLCPLPLSSSTWSFNPPVSSTSDLFASGGLSKLSGGKSVNSSAGGGASTGATWSEGNATPGQPGGAGSSELWAPPKRPPPGLSAKPGSQGSQGQQSQSNNSGAPTANGWLSNRWGGPQNSWSHLAPTGQAGSTWLLLRNLTPQIDGSTLKTLCLQHGPLQNFHLYLNHGIALAKYASREEANKAQGALNNCVLGNTTIFAESPSEADVLQLLQHLGHSTGGQQNSNQSSGSWRQAAKPEPSYSQGLWAGAGGASGTGGGGTSLWGDTTDQHRNTPSSINSFLPGDLLGGESI